jgi:CRP-like cAMP-binding protein
MIDYAFRKLRARDDVSAEEEASLTSAVSEMIEVGKDVTFVRADVPLTNSNILLEGLVCRYRDMASGERQVTEVHVPGDFVDLHSFPLQRLDHNILSLVPSRIAVVPHDRLRAITENEPHLTRLLWLTTTIDAAIHREWMVSLGRRSALGRVAHVLWELYERFKVVGLTEGLSYALPLTQVDLAECLGLTSIHVNRTLRALRLQKLVTFRNRTVTIHDLSALQAVAEFSANYLFLDKHRR